mmetsp:Transcript_24836/g.72747  ORF Transcript_24836/g.72747 Transcript_24836/m.72747 type:complete len:116 (-) Transcript_24836:26-373(-)
MQTKNDIISHSDITILYFSRKLPVCSLAVIVLLPSGFEPFFGEFLIPQKFGIHALRGNVLLPPLLLDAIGMRLVRIVVRTGVLLLHHGYEKSRSVPEMLLGGGSSKQLYRLRSNW